MGTGYLRRQTNHRTSAAAPATAQNGHLARMTGHELAWHIEAVVSKIHAGHYKHYVRGGFSRRDRKVLTAPQVAQRCGADSDYCLFEIKDPRIEQAVRDCGLIVLSPATRVEDRGQPEVRVWRQSIVY